MSVTKTDFAAIQELRKSLRLAQMSVISESEMQTVQNILELKTRSDIELQNIRDAVVAHYALAACNNEVNTPKIIDAMSAITATIDREKVLRGLPV